MNENYIKLLSEEKPMAWANPYKLPFEKVKALSSLTVSKENIESAEALLQRFAPFFIKKFPETEKFGGLIESPFECIPEMKTALEKTYGFDFPGNLYLKMDSHLAVAGSVKARGGIYEVLKYAEKLAVSHGLISYEDNYEKFLSEEMRRFLGQYTVQAGSTGNLGMSIGLMSAALGFKVKIHMSADAKQWKKDLLRSGGVEVLEYDSDYSYAVKMGREESAKDEYSYFIDDENSVDLFIGYATAASRLKKQLEDKNITVDEKHPLLVFIPTGVGNTPAGISYGLKLLYGDNVHCFFVEPAYCSSVVLGILTGLHEKANVRDFGIRGNTEADGLACAAPSGLITRLMTNHVSGGCTVSDGKLFDYLRMLYKSENIRIEPSSCSAFEGAVSFYTDKEFLQYRKKLGDSLSGATAVCWATGGKMIPDAMYEEYLNTYIE